MTDDKQRIEDRLREEANQFILFYYEDRANTVPTSLSQDGETAGYDGGTMMKRYMDAHPDKAGMFFANLYAYFMLSIGGSGVTVVDTDD